MTSSNLTRKHPRRATPRGNRHERPPHRNGEYLQGIEELVSNDYQGDCDDYALFLYLIAKEMELDVRYVIGMGIIGGHAWIQINVEGIWVDYDSTSNRVCEGCVSKHFSEIEYYEQENKE